MLGGQMVKLRVLESVVAVDVEIWVVVVLLHKVSVVQKIAIAIFGFYVDVLTVQSHDNNTVLRLLDLLILDGVMLGLQLLLALGLYVPPSPALIVGVGHPAVLHLWLKTIVWVAIFRGWVCARLRLYREGLTQICKFLHAIIKFVLLLLILIANNLHLKRS